MKTLDYNNNDCLITQINADVVKFLFLLFFSLYTIDFDSTVHLI